MQRTQMNRCRIYLLLVALIITFLCLSADGKKISRTTPTDGGVLQQSPTVQRRTTRAERLEALEGDISIVSEEKYEEYHMGEGLQPVESGGNLRGNGDRVDGDAQSRDEELDPTRHPMRQHLPLSDSVTTRVDNPCIPIWEEFKTELEGKFKATVSLTFSEQSEDVLCSFNHRGQYQELELMRRSFMYMGSQDDGKVFGAFYMNWGYEAHCRVSFSKNPLKIEKEMNHEFTEEGISEELETYIEKMVKAHSRAHYEDSVSWSVCEPVPAEPYMIQAIENEDRSFTISQAGDAMSTLASLGKDIVPIRVKTSGHGGRDFPDSYVIFKLSSRKDTLQYGFLTPCSGVNGEMRRRIGKPIPGEEDKLESVIINVDVDGVDASAGCPWSGSSTVKFTTDVLNLVVTSFKHVLTPYTGTVTCDMTLTDCATRTCMLLLMLLFFLYDTLTKSRHTLKLRSRWYR